MTQQFNSPIQQHFMVVKRSGKHETFDPAKLNKWAEWAAGIGVDWSTVVLAAIKKCSNNCSTVDLHKAMISACVDMETIAHLKMAAKLYIGDIYKRVFGDWRKIPSLKSKYKQMVKLGLWEDMGYSDADLEYLNSKIDHYRDLDSTLPEVQQIIDKYAIRDKVAGVMYETPQFMYMRMAMGNMAKIESNDLRLMLVTQLYDAYSKKQINPPSPFSINLGTPKRHYASCCVFVSGDSADSLAAGDHIAYKMTCSSAGIGSNIITRSKGDKVRNGQVVHQGKLPYYAMQEKAVAANVQAGRGGANTVHFTVLDPEWDDLIKLKNVQTVSSKRIKDLDYSVQFNPYFAQKALNNEDWMLVSLAHAPKLWKLFYSSNLTDFVTEYKHIESDSSIPKTFKNARKMALEFLSEAFGTGRIYEQNVYETNKHTPFLETIHSSNLCVAPETEILTSEGYVQISTLENKKVKVWNGVEWSEVIIKKTGSNQQLVRVKTQNGCELVCTPYHKFYLQQDGVIHEFRAGDLQKDDPILIWRRPDQPQIIVQDFVESVEFLDRRDTTYCCNEPKRHTIVVNGILTGQCQEIALPTAPFENVFALDDPNEGEQRHGEIGLCNLSAIDASIESDEEYERVAYLTCLQIDNVMEIMDYPFKHLKVTAQNRRSIGVGVTNVAYAMAKKGYKYSSPEGKRYIGYLAERHSYFLHKAAIRLAQERGICKWPTKYNSGWLPIDTCNKNVWDVVGFKPTYDWESLRQELKQVGGLRFSVLEAHMPCESSSVASGHTNGWYPIRAFKLVKTSTNKTNFIAPDLDTLKDNYELAWDISTKDLTECYALIQCFTGQAISADFYHKYEGEERKISAHDALKDWLYRVHLGLKTRYYINSATGIKQINLDEITSHQSETEIILDEDDDEAVCESCSL